MPKLQNTERKNYALINSGKMPRGRKETVSSSEEEFDIHGEEELVEDDVDYLDMEADEEDEFLEDGEIPEEENEHSDLQETIAKLAKQGDLKKLKELLSASREKGKRLKQELELEQRKEKDKEIREVLGELNRINKRNNDLERSIVNSRNGTPSGSPSRKRKPKSTVRMVQKKKTESTRSRSRNEHSSEDSEKEKSEYEDILSSFLNLKQGNAEAYTELVQNAMAATDNIIKLKHDRNRQKPLISKRVKGRDSLVNNTTEQNKALELLSTLQLALGKNNGNVNRTTEDALNACAGKNEVTKALQSIHTLMNNSEESEETEEQERSVKCKIGRKDNRDGEKKKGKKLISGKCTKPDETNIKQVLTFPHEKLDPRHTGTGDWVFDKLNFALLVVGELETAVSEETSEEERLARINIAKTMCYHKAYLSDQDLREGYDQIIKSVEQGKNSWKTDLGERLHDLYDYQANKIIREKVQQSGDKRQEKARPQQGSSPSPAGNNAMEQVVYCAAYNRGKCSLDDHHEGKFGGKSVTKWHICSKCHKRRERRLHRESECYIKI